MTNSYKVKMNTAQLLVKEFERRVFEESYERIYSCLNRISDQQLWVSPNEHIPPVGCLILHLTGNARQWIGSGIGKLPDKRLRSAEFLVHPDITKAELVLLLANLKQKVSDVLKSLNDEELEIPVTIQGLHETYFSVVIHVIEHFSYHTGQITTLTKWLTNNSTDFYDDDQLDDRISLN